jgi:hypothetical protein
MHSFEKMSAKIYPCQVSVDHRSSPLSCTPSRFVDTKQSEKELFICPDYSKYLYFLFAPTLIYRDQYPRNAIIRWDFVARMFGQVLAAMFYVYYVVVRFCVPTFADLNRNQITLPVFVSVLFHSILPGSLFLLLGKSLAWIEKYSALSVDRFLWIFALLVECVRRDAAIRRSHVL